MLQAFFKAFKEHGYAVLSRKHGICFSSRQYTNYGDTEELPDHMLIELLRSQAKQAEYNENVYYYWNHRPITHGKWIKMLLEAGFTVVEFRTLDEIRNALKREAGTSDDSRLF